MPKLIKVLCCLICLSSLFFQCGERSPNSELNIPRNVKQYCGNCHIVPEAQSLTIDLWESSILPKMSQFYIWTAPSKYDYANVSFFDKQGTIPMNDKTWAEIVNYYTTYGLKAEYSNPTENWPIQTFFEEVIVNFEDDYPAEVTSAMISNKQVLIGSGRALHRMNSDYSLDMLIPLNRDITHIYPFQEQIYLVSTSTINPHHGPFGEVAILNATMDTAEMIIEKLERPVQMYRNENEIIISEFGFKTGSLSIRNTNNLNKSDAIHQLPGAYRIIPANLTDSEEKILVTSASQAQEGIYALIQNEDRYEIEELIRFKPEFGLSDIDLADINGDGLDDLLVINGDNADYSIIPKKYHGVNVYLNKGNYKFNHAYSIPLHGATQGKFIDVDNDNRVDIMVSSYFAEYEEDRVVLLKNESDDHLDFEPFRFEHGWRGNWMIMERGDINNDSQLDILLGGYSRGPKQRQDSLSKSDTDLLLLLNKSDKHINE